jgi:hypothetical protein
MTAAVASTTIQLAGSANEFTVGAYISGSLLSWSSFFYGRVLRHCAALG